MALSIRSAVVEGLARDLARRRGETITEAIGEALEARLEDLEASAENRREVLAAIAAECARSPDLDARSPDEILGYDEMGGFAHGDR
jgi:antitoxin VapB